jgi:hypothetical protein
VTDSVKKEDEDMSIKTKNIKQNKEVRLNFGKAKLI